MAVGSTIVALSSGALPSGVAVIRLSGPAVRAVAEAVTGGVPSPRQLVYRSIRAGDEILDHGLVAYFPAPHSFTGEECLELQVHGSRAVVQAILRTVTALDGVVLAQAGDFTRRAFENGKLDLTSIEGLGDLLAADTETQRAQARSRLSGELRALVETWVGILLDLRAQHEARLDFSDEGDVDADLPPAATAQLLGLQAAIAAQLDGYERGRIVREGFRVALAGPPNAGKSSLLNALARSDIAIVTPEAGTTRDVREVALDLNGRLVILVDMAGLREADSLAEAEGVRRARTEIAKADLVLWLTAPDTETLPPPSGLAWRVATKSDLRTGPTSGRAISALTGDGIAQLLADIGALASGSAAEPSLLSRERDRAALTACLVSIESALARHEPELVAESLRAATASLERFIGRVDPEAVLDRLFLGFCIGK
jgi:tRNA modification GTPase